MSKCFNIFKYFDKNFKIFKRISVVSSLQNNKFIGDQHIQFFIAELKKPENEYKKFSYFYLLYFFVIFRTKLKVEIAKMLGTLGSRELIIEELKNTLSCEINLYNNFLTIYQV